MKSLVPATISPPFARYSHGVELPPNQRILRTSGQLGLASDGAIPEDAFDQARICFANIAAILAEGAMTPQDIFHLSAYVTDRAHMQGYMKARDLFLADTPTDRLPSSTLVIVSGFTRPEFKVEVEVWAAAP
ncbi:MAG: enamine deaminase RidA [Rhodobacteraceae bacterium]|nr:enamine deaminase RidA [Paracoccaceae bacterium]MAY44438.1 enamine deaminase RidA [Paracoccaceae bacterium]